MLSPEYWSAIATPPTTITMAPSSAAGRTCCGTSMTSAPSTPMLRHWPGGLTPSTGFTTGPKPALIPRPSGGAPPNWPWNGGCWPSANPSGTTRRQPRPSCADASSATSRACPVLDTGTLCLCGRTRSAFRQQRRRAQPVPPGHQSQGQRWHPLGTRHTEQDDAGLPLRHLARPRSQPTDRLPSTAQIPSTMNCYGHQGSHEYQTRTEIRRGNRAGALLVMIQPRSAQSSDEPSAWPAGLSNTATHDNVTLSWNDPGAVASDLFGERMPDQRSSGLRRP